MPCFLTFHFKFRLLAEPKFAHNSRAFYIRHFSVSDAEYILSPFKLTRGVLHTLQGRQKGNRGNREGNTRCKYI